MTHAFNEDANAADAGFGTRIRKAVFWRSGSQLVGQIVSWAATLAVIRLLEPADYGLFAMTQVIMNFMGFLNGYGLVGALVQADKVTPKILRQAFGMILLLNGTLAVAQLALASLAADYYNQPMVADLLRVQALIYLATPFISVPEALMGRSLEFKRPAVVHFIAALAAALTAIGGALMGWGVWTLVFAPLAGFWVKAIGYMVATRFFVWPSFDFRGTRGMILFGASLLGSQLFFIIQSQADIFIAGRVLTPHHLGLYAEALFLTQIFVSRFIPPLNDVAFPAYARMQSDPAMLNRAFCKAARLILLIACPLYFGMAVTAEPMIETLFGSKWLEMVPFVQILACSMPAYALQVLFGPALNAIGRPGLTARISAIGALILPAAFLGGIQFGAIGLAYAWAVGLPVLMIATAWIASRAMGLSLMALAQSVWPAVLAAAGMAVLVAGLAKALPPMPAPLTLGILGLGGAAIYAAMLCLFARSTVNDLVGLLRKQSPAVA